MNNITTKKRICEKCASEYQPNSNRQKYCSVCQLTIGKEKALQSYYKNHEKRIEYMRRYYHGEIATDKSQSGSRNNNWKGGFGLYRTYIKESCERCGSKRFLVVHHRDHDRQNNDPRNLETLCKSCHQKEHEVWKNFTKGIVRSSENKESEE